VDVFKQLKLAELLLDPITLEMIHTMRHYSWMIKISTCGGTDFLTQVTFGVKPRSIYISGAASSTQLVGLSNWTMFLVLD
jgi:hypothetical protein